MVNALGKNFSISEKIRQLKARRYTIDLPVLVFSYMAVIFSWSATYWVTWLTAIFMLLLFLPILTLLSLLMDLLLEWQRLRLWPIETNWRGLILYITFTVFLIAAGPAYAYSHGIRITHNFVKEFDLDVKAADRDFVIIESIALAGRSRTFRSITTVYSVLDPIAEAKTKLRKRLQNEPGWLLSNTSYFWGSCDRNQLGRYMTIFLTEDGALHVAIHYGVPNYCLLS